LYNRKSARKENEKVESNGKPLIGEKEERERTLTSGVEERRDISPNGVVTGRNTWTGLDGGLCIVGGAIEGRHSFEACWFTVRRSSERVCVNLGVLGFNMCCGLCISFFCGVSAFSTAASNMFAFHFCIEIYYINPI
jgi:hypothetical protein